MLLLAIIVTLALILVLPMELFVMFFLAGFLMFGTTCIILKIGGIYQLGLGTWYASWWQHDPIGCILATLTLAFIVWASVWVYNLPPCTENEQN